MHPLMRDKKFSLTFENYAAQMGWTGRVLMPLAEDSDDQSLLHCSAAWTQGPPNIIGLM